MKAARLGVEEVTYSDRINHLPDDLLFRILSFIPVSDAMSTSLLSKRWKSLWKMMSTLEYDENSLPNIGSFGFHEFCRRSLKLHEAPLLKTLNLILKKHSDFVDSFLFPSIRSTLLEITIASTSYPYCTISFSDNIRVFQTLVVLKLQGRILLDVVDSPVCFRSLKILHLNCVKFSSEESFCELLSACPVLEDLLLQRLCSVGYFLFTISVPSLQSLFIATDLLLQRLCSVGYFLSNLLLHFLKDFPNLRTLKLNHTHPNYDIEDQPCLVSKPSSVPKCLSFHLETLQWIGYAGTHEEIEAMVYVLKNSHCLKNATISLHSTGTENGLIMMIKELLSMSRVSPLCQLLIVI